MKDLHSLPKLRDSLSYVYVEQAVVQRNQSAVEVVNEDGRTMIPVASLSVLMLGPGTSITHAAVGVLADCGCSVLWVGDGCTKFYAQGTGETRKAYRLLHQAELVCDPDARRQIVMRMYKMRFDQDLPPDLTLPQIRGFEGVRVRSAYARASQEYNVPWQGRRYDRSDWEKGDPVNRALSAANALLNGVCHAAIVSGGYSPGLGFIHTGKQLSFVYDIADLYKTEITIPAAFETASKRKEKVEPLARQLCRVKFRETRLLQRILPDIDAMLGLDEELPAQNGGDVDDDPALPDALWGPLEGEEE
jgi:CRISPR-associated protein Cas1